MSSDGHTPGPPPRPETPPGTDAPGAQEASTASPADISVREREPAAPTGLLGDSPADAARRRALRKMRVLATSLLALAAVVYVLTHLLTDRSGFWGFVESASEAAMVGAIADWFAVTALFRHPLGIPIPHTAIIPRKKDALGETLSEFVASNFLRKATVAPKIMSAHITERAGAWLARPESQETVVARAGQALDYVLARVDSSAVESLARNVLVPKLVDLPKAGALGMAMERVVADGSHKRLVDIVVDQAFDWLYNNPQILGEQVSRKSPDWVPRFVNSGIANRLQREVLGWLGDIRDRPDHKVRRALDEWLLGVARDMQDADSAVAAKTESVLAEVLQHPSIVTAIVEMWNSLSGLLRGAVTATDGEVHRRIRSVLADFADRCVNDTEFAAGVDARLADAVGAAAESFGPELASVISDTIAGWDAAEASEKIELLAGKDLQFIRINGTVIGALVGMIIHALTLVLP